MRWGGVFTSLTSTFLTLRNMYTLRMLSYDPGGWGDVLTSSTSTSLTLRCMYTLHVLSFDRQGGWGRCVYINVLDEHFSDVTEHVHVAHAVV